MPFTSAVPTEALAAVRFVVYFLFFYKLLVPLVKCLAGEQEVHGHRVAAANDQSGPRVHVYCRRAQRGSAAESALDRLSLHRTARFAPHTEHARTHTVARTGARRR